MGLVEFPSISGLVGLSFSVSVFWIFVCNLLDHKEIDNCASL